MTDSDVAGIGEHLNRPLGRIGIVISVGVLIAVHAVIWWVTNREVDQLVAWLSMVPLGLMSVYLWLIFEHRRVWREVADIKADIERDFAARGEKLPPAPPAQPLKLTKADWVELTLIVLLLVLNAWDVVTGDWSDWYAVAFFSGALAHFVEKATDVRHPRVARIAGGLTWVLMIAAVAGVIHWWFAD